VEYLDAVDTFLGCRVGIFTVEVLVRTWDAEVDYLDGGGTLDAEVEYSDAVGTYVVCKVGIFRGPGFQRWII
jgi:hypothetical protein